MARTTDIRKTEYLGIPLDKPTKDRLKRVATKKKQKHTEIAREYVVNGIERDERELSHAK